jgi:glycosyltransferase involved in cell wall biosynthesis
VLDGLRLACEDRTLLEDVRVQFVGRVDGYEKEIRERGLEKLVECVGPVSSEDSIRLMHSSDVLILLQTISGEGRDVIGGKVFEYLAARKPILGIVPDDGGDAWLMRNMKAGVITGIEDPKRVAQGFQHYWGLWKENSLATAVSDCDISRFSRRNLTQDLAELFAQILNHN